MISKVTCLKLSTFFLLIQRVMVHIYQSQLTNKYQIYKISAFFLTIKYKNKYQRTKFKIEKLGCFKSCVK